jgi:hypothetical protein
VQITTSDGLVRLVFSALSSQASDRHTGAECRPPSPVWCGCSVYVFIGGLSRRGEGPPAGLSVVKSLATPWVSDSAGATAAGADPFVRAEELPTGVKLPMDARGCGSLAAMVLPPVSAQSGRVAEGLTAAPLLNLNQRLSLARRPDSPREMKRSR